MPFNATFSWWIKTRMNGIKFSIHNPFITQKKVFNYLVNEGGKTVFGVKHGFKTITTPSDFKSKVPLCTYEDLYPHIQQAINGQQDVLWPGEVNWFSKSSGTTVIASFEL